MWLPCKLQVTVQPISSSSSQQPPATTLQTVSKYIFFHRDRRLPDLTWLLLLKKSLFKSFINTWAWHELQMHFKWKNKEVQLKTRRWLRTKVCRFGIWAQTGLWFLDNGACLAQATNWHLHHAAESRPGERPLAIRRQLTANYSLSFISVDVIFSLSLSPLCHSQILSALWIKQ